MSVLKIYGTLKTDVELKSSAKEFFKIWRSDSHKLPNITSSHIQKVKLHEGDWDTHVAIKSWLLVSVHRSRLASSSYMVASKYVWSNNNQLT